MKILIISPAFPPISGVGVVRMSSLCTYLAKMNDDVTVICDEPNSENSNGNSIYVPNGIKIIRINCFQKSDRQKAALYYDTINSLLSQNKFDIALVTVGPYYTLRICYKLFNKFGLKYIIDFRDVGAFEHIRRHSIIQLGKIILSRIYEGYFEFMSIAYAKKVVSVTEGWKRKKKRDYFLFAKKMECIENGYDGERLSSITLPDSENRYTIAIMGKLAYYSANYAKILFSSLKKVFQKYEGAQFIHISDAEEKVNTVIRDTNLDLKYYKCTGFLDYTEGIKVLSTANIFVIVDDRKDAMGTKIYDYLYLNKPIIYVGNPNTALSRFVDKFENGFSCSTEKETIDAIEYIFKNNISRLDSNYEKSAYSREFQNVKYRKLMENILCEL